MTNIIKSYLTAYCFIQGIIIGLKISGHINISWIFVLLPIWLPVAIMLLLVIVWYFTAKKI
jgi:hypothetical protein